MNETVVQGIGFIGLALFIVSYQIKSNRALFLCQMLGCLVFCVQFFMMGAYTGAISLVINIMRNVLLLKADKWRWAKGRGALCVILLLLAGASAFTWDGWASLLPLASFAVTTVGYWTRNAQKIRLSQLFGAPCIMIYDLIIRSWGGALSEAIALVSIVVSILRFGWRNLAEQTT